MPSTVPVPSKGALRALRRLALGTTCTVAFATGVLTEDRRRRIHSVQAVTENARKIKSSRHYHATGAADAIEARIMRIEDDNFSSPTRSFSSACALAEASNGPMTQNSDDVSWFPSTHPPRIISSNQAIPVRPSFPPRGPSGSYQVPGHKHIGPTQLNAEPDRPTESHHQNKSTSTPSFTSRQHKLASDVLKLLKDNAAPDAVGAAAARFLDAFDESLPIDESGVVRDLVDAAAQLSKACCADNDFNTAERVIRTILDHGSVDYDTFLSFDPEAIMRGLVQAKTSEDPASLHSYRAGLRRACSLYLTKFKTMPNTLSRQMLQLGSTLCKQASQHELFDLIEGLYWRVQRFSQRTPLHLVQHLITANYKEGRHSKCRRYFKRFYVCTSPNQWQFYDVLGFVLDGALQSGNQNAYEEILGSAALMAEREGILMSSTWILKLLGHDWRTYEDLARTRALFDRLQPHIHLVGHPGSVYSAIIQFCVEAGDEQAAAEYYAQVMELPDVGKAIVKIHGHFTLAKAMRDDWNGVRDGLDKMQQLNPDPEEFSAAFTPILKLFAQQHNLNETENFLRSFIQTHGGLLTPYLSNLMIDQYLKAGELDSVCRWLDYMATVNCKVDPSFFNVVLENCYHKFGLAYGEIHKMYKNVAGLHSRANQFVNRDSLSTLRNIAILSSGEDVGKGAHRLQKLKLQAPMRTNSSQEVRTAMTIALGCNKSDKALKIYRRALEDQLPLSEHVVSLALKATLDRYPNDIDAATAFLRYSQQAGQDVGHATSLLFAHMASEDGNDVQPDIIKNAAQNTIASLDKGGILGPLRVAARAMNTLVVGKHYQEALDLWSSVSHREGHQPLPLNAHILTTILRAYAGIHDAAGIKWVIETLRARHIIPDRHFLKTLTKIHTSAKKVDAPEFLRSVVQALEVVREMRRDMVQDKEAATSQLMQIIESAIEAEAVGALAPGPREPTLASPELPAISGEKPECNIDKEATRVGVAVG